MKTLVLALLLSLPVLADGTITVQPTSDPPATWIITELYVGMAASGPSVVVTIKWLTASGAEAHLDAVNYPRVVTLTGANVVAFCAALSPAGTDTFSGTAGAAKRFRQRATKFLIDGGFITRGANES